MYLAGIFVEITGFFLENAIGNYCHLWNITADTSANTKCAPAYSAANKPKRITNYNRTVFPLIYISIPSNHARHGVIPAADVGVYTVGFA